MTGNDNELPPEESDLPPQEFLVAESVSESPSDLMGTVEGADGQLVAEPDGAAPGSDGVPPEDASGSELLSVDELLSEAVVGDGLLEEAALLEAPLSSVPTFQLRLTQLLDEQKPAVKKTLEAQGVQVGEKTLATLNPVVSQLTEFQAIMLLQGLRGLGVRASCSVFLPLQQSPSEEDLALGDLSAIPEAALEPVVESAPSVVLPKNEKEVMLCSPSTLPNSNVIETFGLVIAHRSIARRLFREEEVREKLEKELRSVPNRPGSAVASSHLQQVLRDLLLDLRKGALGKGGNSVLGVKIEAFPESSTSDPQLEQLRLVAFGTAAVVEKT